MTEEGVGKPSSDVVTRAPRTGRKPRCSPSLCKACRRRVHARGRGISEGAQPGEGLGTRGRFCCVSRLVPGNLSGRECVTHETGEGKKRRVLSNLFLLMHRMVPIAILLPK